MPGTSYNPYSLGCATEIRLRDGKSNYLKVEKFAQKMRYIVHFCMEQECFLIQGEFEEKRRWYRFFLIDQLAWQIASSCRCVVNKSRRSKRNWRRPCGIKSRKSRDLILLIDCLLFAPLEGIIDLCLHCVDRFYLGCCCLWLEESCTSMSRRDKFMGHCRTVHNNLQGAYNLI